MGKYWNILPIQRIFAHTLSYPCASITDDGNAEDVQVVDINVDDNVLIWVKRKLNCKSLIQDYCRWLYGKNGGHEYWLLGAKSNFGYIPKIFCSSSLWSKCFRFSQGTVFTLQTILGCTLANLALLSTLILQIWIDNARF